MLLMQPDLSLPSPQSLSFTHPSLIPLCPSLILPSSLFILPNLYPFTHPSLIPLYPSLFPLYSSLFIFPSSLFIPPSLSVSIHLSHTLNSICLLPSIESISLYLYHLFPLSPFLSLRLSLFPSISIIYSLSSSPLSIPLNLFPSSVSILSLHQLLSFFQIWHQFQRSKLSVCLFSHNSTFLCLARSLASGTLCFRVVRPSVPPSLPL